MTRRLLPFVALLALLTAPQAYAHGQPTLHFGTSSTRNCAIKWMISGRHSHRPNVFTVHGTFTAPLHPNCNYWGRRLSRAVVAYKYRLGYPKKLVKPVAGPYFFKLLRGPRDQRPLLWIALAQRRAKAIKPGPTKRALKIIAFETRQIGTHEQCGNLCNRGWIKGRGGYSVDDFERMAGLLGAQWCGIFQWDSFRLNGVEFAAGYNPFFVPSIGQWALDHGYALVRGKDGRWYRLGHASLTASARVGSLVAFLSSPSTVTAHHVGLVSAITASGYYTIEGNSGDAVRRHWYPWGTALRVFVNVPGVS